MVEESKRSQSDHLIFKDGKLQCTTWADVVTSWNDVELGRDRVDNPVSGGYQLCVKNVSGLLQLNTLDVYKTTYRVYISMFDILYRRFVGRTWCSKEVSLTGQQTSINFNTTAYFHTPISDSNVVLAIEIVACQFPKNPLPGDATTGKRRSMGWSILRPFTVGTVIKDVADLQPTMKKLDVFNGSPRALLYMEDPLESNPNLKPVVGCQLHLILSRHNQLGQAIHLLPENSLFGSDERVPGLTESCSKTEHGRDFYLKPRPLKSCVGYIEKLSVNLGTTVDKFEEELCRRVNDDRLRRDNLTDDGKTVTVTERRLMIGVHNGFCYVQKPQYAHLEPEAMIGRSRTASFGRGKRKDASASVSYGPSDRLVLRSRIELNEMLPDPLVAIVMQLEYVLAVPPNDQRLIKGSMSSLRSQPFTVMLRWGAWQPYFAHPTRDPSGPATATLHGGTDSNPDSLFFYKDLKNEDKAVSNGEIKFSYLTTDEPPKSETSVFEQVSTIMKPSPRKPPSGAAPSEDKLAPVQDAQSFESYNLEVRHLDAPDDSFPVHAPPIYPVAQSAPALTRASYARLYAAGFPEILDRDGSPAVSVVTSDAFHKVDLNREVTDVMQANEIILQFLAFTLPSSAPGEASSPPIHSIFLSFQFYRFRSVTTQRLALLRKPQGAGGDPCLLRKIESGEKMDEGQPGLEVKYHVDPAHLKPGENGSFLRYLATHKLHVDVWDGDSLLLLGSLSVPLKHILRGGNPAVCANHEVDVIMEDHLENTPTMTGDLATGGAVRPLGLSKLFRGKLHMRLGNVGFPSESKTSAISLLKKNHLVVADLSGCGFAGGTLSSANQQRKNGVRPSRVRAKRMAESNQELSELLLVNATRDKNADEASNKENLELSPEMKADRKRKIARMLAVRQQEAQESNGDVTKPITTGQRALIHAQERNMKLRDLRTVATYREQLKGDQIMEILLMSITTRHTLRPTLGAAEFLEFQLKNPFAKQQTVTIECDSDELRVITDSREWRYFKSLNGVQTPVEENMFNFEPITSLPQIFLRPKETVFIPFRYQGYEADHKVATQNPGQKFRPTTTTLQPTKDAVYHGTIKSKVVKAILRTIEGRPLSVLHLTVDPQPHVVDQTFRFYNPEHTFLKKTIRLPPSRLDSDEQFHVVCSDPEVVCQGKSLGRVEPREIFLKSPCGDSPSVRRFYISIYSDPFLAVPSQIWQLYVHSLQRVDVNCVLGQTSRFSLVLRGTQTARMVRCYSSHPNEMQVQPDEVFLLPPNSVHEINAGVRTTSASSGTRFMYVNVVDSEYHQLLRSWLVAVKTREPVITKEFSIELHRSGGKGSNKIITYTNPYPNRKTFVLMTSRSDLLTFRETQLELGPGEQTTIGLRFAAGLHHGGKFPVYIFINDQDDKNEETFLVNVTYL